MKILKRVFIFFICFFGAVMIYAYWSGEKEHWDKDRAVEPKAQAKPKAQKFMTPGGQVIVPLNLEHLKRGKQ